MAKTPTSFDQSGGRMSLCRILGGRIVHLMVDPGFVWEVCILAQSFLS